ncbi:hypothetical protein F4803DRAFT_553512 [Xylaria telfairii]|nr:hypothetical protein F4803DRAFT_553512 [Xylaria telfairii]
MCGPFTSYSVRFLLLLMAAYGLLNIYMVFDLKNIPEVEYHAEECPLVVPPAEPWNMPLVCYSMGTWLRWVFVSLDVPSILQVYFACLIKQLRDVKARGEPLTTFLLAGSGASLFLRRQSSVSYATLHIPLFIMFLQGPWVAGAQPLPTQSFHTGLDSLHSDELSRSANQIPTGIPQDTYQIIVISLAVIAGIAGISASIWGPCLPSLWAYPRREWEEDSLHHRVDSDGQSPTLSNTLVNSTNSANEEQESSSSRRTTNITGPENRTDASSVSTFDPEHDLQHVGEQFDSDSASRYPIVHMAEDLDNLAEIPVTRNNRAALDQSHETAQSAADIAPTDLAIHHSALIDGLIERRDFAPFFRQSDIVADNKTSVGESTGAGSIATKLDSSGSSSPNSSRAHESSPEAKRP